MYKWIEAIRSIYIFALAGVSPNGISFATVSLTDRKHTERNFYICSMTIFSKIIAGQIPSYKIAEDDYFFAFLDIAPLREGHTLVIPKIETDKFFDVPDEWLSRILLFAKPIGHAIEKAFDCNRCGLTVIGLEVPHAHVHLIPIDSINDMDFKKNKLKLSPDEMKAVQEKIISKL